MKITILCILMSLFSLASLANEKLGDRLLLTPPTAYSESDWFSAKFCRSKEAYFEFYYHPDSGNLYIEQGSDSLLAFLKNESGDNVLYGLHAKLLNDLAVMGKPRQTMAEILADSYKNGMFVMAYAMGAGGTKQSAWENVKSFHSESGAIEKMNALSMDELWENVLLKENKSDMDDIKVMAKISFKVISVSEKEMQLESTILGQANSKSVLKADCVR